MYKSPYTLLYNHNIYDYIYNHILYDYTAISVRGRWVYYALVPFVHAV